MQGCVLIRMRRASPLRQSSPARFRIFDAGIRSRSLIRFAHKCRRPRLLLRSPSFESRPPDIKTPLSGRFYIGCGDACRDVSCRDDKHASVTDNFLLKISATPPQRRRASGFRIPASSRRMQQRQALHAPVFGICGDAGIRTLERFYPLPR